MKQYDVIVIGAGDVGLGLAFKALAGGRRVALIDRGHPGGTCVNYGCVPSKTLIQAADRIREIREAAVFGIRTSIVAIDFPVIMDRMRKAVISGREGIGKALEESENLDFFKHEGRFLDDRTLAVGDKKIRGKKIFIATGARPALPAIKGLAGIPVLTNETVLELEKRPESLIFIGGGYVALEYAHFFSALGTRVTILHRHPTLLPSEEPEISELLKKKLQPSVELNLEVEPREVQPNKDGVTVRFKDQRTGAEKETTAEALFVSAGRRSNADLLQVEKAGVEIDPRGFIQVDDTLRTSRKHIWALGDAIGRAMFTHAGDKEAEVAWHNATHRKKIAMDFEGVPHAVFTSPQIASVGLTEEQARREHDILVGRAKYSDTVMGEAMDEQEGFAKAIVEKATGRILGFHLIGPQAATLIQEVVNAVINRQDIKSITASMHIFPALSNLIPETLANLE
jgi:dihydrolipoamide dehydrogenase